MNNAAVKISAARIPDHEPTDACIRLIVFEGDAETDTRSVLDILEFSESTNANRTRRDLLQAINMHLDDDMIHSLDIQIIRR